MQTNDEIKYIPMYKSYIDAVSKLPDVDRLAIYEAIFQYGFTGIEPVFENPYLEMGWALVKPNLVNNITNAKKNAINGAKGGRPKKSVESITEQVTEQVAEQPTVQVAEQAPIVVSSTEAWSEKFNSFSKVLDESFEAEMKAKNAAEAKAFYASKGIDQSPSTTPTKKVSKNASNAATVGNQIDLLDSIADVEAETKSVVVHDTSSEPIEKQAMRSKFNSRFKWFPNESLMAPADFQALIGYDLSSKFEWSKLSNLMSGLTNKNFELFWDVYTQLQNNEI